MLKMTNTNNTSSITHTGELKLGPMDTNGNSMLEIDVSSNNTIMRLRSDGKVGINVDDAYMDADSALHVGDGNIVLGSSIVGDQNRSLKMIGTSQITTLKHDGLFKVEVTPTSGASKTPLAIGSNTVALDVSGENGSFTINNKLSMTTTAATATIDSVGADLKLSGNSVDNFVEITDEYGVKIGLATDKKFKVGENIDMDLSGKIVMNGDLTISSTTVGGAGNLACDGTGTFGGVAVIDGSSNASFGYTGKTPAIKQTSAGATTVSAESGQSISFNIGADNKANIDLNGKFTIANADIDAGTAQFDNGGLFVSAGTGQNQNLENNIKTISITLTTNQAAQLNGTNTGAFIIGAATTTGFPIGSTPNLAVTRTGSGSDAVVTVVMSSATSITSITVNSTGTGYAQGDNVTIISITGGDATTIYNNTKPMLYDESKNSFGVLDNHVYVTGKQFHVSGHNGTGPRGMVVDPTDTDQDVVTIEGNLRVNGNITSAQSSSALSTASVTSALTGSGMTTSSNVLIGSNNQSDNVNNTYLVIKGSANNNSIYAHGPIVSAEYFAAASDLNLKENISTINSALDKTNRLRGVYFTKKADVTGRREVGVIAQEVEKVFPEVVMGGEGKKTVAYANLCGVLIEAVKELSRENVSQAAEIKSLRNNIDTIRGDIDKLWEHKRTDDKGMVDQLTELKRELAAIKRTQTQSSTKR